MYLASFLDINLLKKVFKSLRDRFMKITKEYKPSGSAGGAPIEPSWPYYKQLQFLSPFIRHRETQGNFHEATGESSKGDSFQTGAKETEEINLTDTISRVTVALKDDRQHSFDDMANSPSLSVAEPSKATLKPDKKPLPSSSKKSKRPKTDSDGTGYLMSVLENTNEFISSVSRREQPDEDDLFGHSVGKQLKKLNAYQRSLAKLKIQLVLHEVAWQQEPTDEANA